jgi:hypothetical protein
MIRMSPTSVSLHGVICEWVPDGDRLPRGGTNVAISRRVSVEAIPFASRPMTTGSGR